MTASQPQVAISGIGLLAAHCHGRERWVERLLQSCPDGRAPVHDPRREGLAGPPGPLHTVGEGAVEAALTTSLCSDLPGDPEIRLAAAAASLALADAGMEHAPAAAALIATYETPGLDRFLRGLVAQAAATGGTALPPPEALWDALFEAHHATTYGTHSFIHLHHLARHIGAHGRMVFINNACASGLYALDEAALWVAQGAAELVVVTAAESPRVPAKRQWFERAGLHATDGCLRPFDCRRTGLVLGEGAAAFVVEPLERAHARGRRPAWRYLGGGFNQEGWKVTIPNFAEPYHERAVRQALATAGLEAGHVDVVVAHGAGTPLSDAYEAKGLTSVFGARSAPPRFTALKGWFGHTLGACALLEAGAALAALERGMLPGAAGFAEPDPRLGITLARETVAESGRTVLKVANGFAGFNAAAIFQRL